MPDTGPNGLFSGCLPHNAFKVANKSARVIIPLAIVDWVVAILAFVVDLPGPLNAVFIVLFFALMVFAVPYIVFWLMADTGWNQLKKDFRAREKFAGKWTTVATGQMAMVSVHSEEFQRSKGRFTGTLRVGATDDALHLSTLFTRIPVMGLFFPPLRIPWRDITRATRYEAAGWTSRSSPTVVSARYDPGYTGDFVELEIGEPRVFIQLPVSILGAGEGQLSFEAP
jgi:hypothetical protein